MAKARKSGGKRKTAGAKEEPEVPRPQTLEQWVASHSIAEPNNLAQFFSSLKVHGEPAEDRLDKEFLPWLVKFVRALDKYEIRIQAWEELKSRCDVLWLLKDLYLFTYPGRTTPDVWKGACRFLKDKLDNLIPRYGTLHKHTSDLFNDPKLRFLGVLNKEMSVFFKEPMNLIATAQKELEVVRNWAEKMGSYKTDAHDLHFYAMATSIRAATGEYHFSELTTLIEAALAAHGAEGEEPFDEKTLERRVQRYAKRMNLDRHRPLSS